MMTNGPAGIKEEKYSACHYKYNSEARRWDALWKRSSSLLCYVRAAIIQWNVLIWANAGGLWVDMTYKTLHFLFISLSHSPPFNANKRRARLCNAITINIIYINFWLSRRARIGGVLIYHSAWSVIISFFTLNYAPHRPRLITKWERTVGMEHAPEEKTKFLSPHIFYIEKRTFQRACISLYIYSKRID